MSVEQFRSFCLDKAISLHSFEPHGVDPSAVLATADRFAAFVLADGADRPPQCPATMSDGVRRCHENNGHDGNHARFGAQGQVVQAWTHDGPEPAGATTAVDA